MSEFLRVMDASESRKRFSESAWIRDIWPPALRRRTFAFFAYQDIINRHLAQGGVSIPELHYVLTQSSLEALPLMIMASDLEDRAILESARVRGVSDPMLDFLMSGHAFAARDYELAAERLERAQLKDPASAELARFRVLALILAGKDHEADALLTRLRQSTPEDPRFAEWIASVRGESD